MTAGEPRSAMSVDPQVLVLHSKLENVQEELKRMGAAMAQISESLQILARLEQGHSGILERLRDGATRFKEQDTRISNMEHDAPGFKQAIGRVDAQGDRISAIENVLPGLKELRVWVIGGVLGGAGMLGVALMKLVLVDPQTQANNQQAVISSIVQQAVNQALSSQLQSQERGRSESPTVITLPPAPTRK